MKAEYAPARPPDEKTSSIDRVVEILSERIHLGTYAIGDTLPTERILSDELQVHRRVIRSAIDRLIADGLIVRRPNCRPVVGKARKSPPSAASETPGRISSSRLIALIAWQGGGPHESTGASQHRIFWGMNQALQGTGYHAVFLDIGPPVSDTARHEADQLKYIVEKGFGGAVFYPYDYNSNRALLAAVSRKVPIVMIDRMIEGVDLDFVGVQNYNAMVDVVTFLINKGHRRIAYLTCWEPIRSVQDRIRAYIDTIKRAGDLNIVETILTVPPYTRDGVWGVVDALFRRPPAQRPTAAACFSDFPAVDLAERLKRLGLRVPQDVAITGFDNVVRTLPDGTGLTTIAQPFEQIGRVAVDLLLRRIKKPSAPTTSIELPGKLIVRSSSP